MRPPPAIAKKIPADARYQAYVPNSVFDSGLVAALGHRPLLLTYYWVRALADELWFSNQQSRHGRLSAKLVSPFLQSAFGVSSRTVTRYLGYLLDLGWLRRSGRWIQVSADTNAGRRYFADASLVRLLDLSVPGPKQLATRAATVLQDLKSTRSSLADAVPPEQLGGEGRYTIVDLSRTTLRNETDRGACLLAIALYRWSWHRRKIESTPGFRRCRVSKEMLGLSLGASRDTIDRWTRRAEELGLVQVEPQGHRRRHVYLFRERAKEEPLPYWAQRIITSSGAGAAAEAMRRLRPDAFASPPRGSLVPDQ